MNFLSASGNYAELAKALGGYGERVTEPGQIADALRRGIAATKEGRPALLEFITTQDKVYSTFQGGGGPRNGRRLSALSTDDHEEQGTVRQNRRSWKGGPAV